MAKLKLELDELQVETFDTIGSGPRRGGTVYALSASRGGLATCGVVTCGDPSCVDQTCSNTWDDPSCDYNPCGESVSCTTEMCNQSDWANQCTGGEECGGTYVC
jgi:hypothetical protein